MQHVIKRGLITSALDYTHSYERYTCPLVLYLIVHESLESLKTRCSKIGKIEKNCQELRYIAFER